MNILWIANDNCANNPYTIVKTINDHFSEHHAELIMSKPNYLKYPSGTLVSDITIQEFINKINNADIIHLNEPVCSGLYPPEANQHFKGSSDKVILWNLLTKKHIVFRHSNGTYGRNNYKQINSFCQLHNIYQTVSTPDLLKLICPSKWLPQPTDLANKIHRFKPPKFTGKIKISHSPTDRYFKSTDYFLTVISELKREGYDIELNLIENQTHEQCMNLRRESHIHFDQFLLGAYGRAAVEGLAIGQIVVVGLKNIIEYVPGHPFVNTTHFSLKDSLLSAISILNNNQTEWVNNGRAWVEKYHDRNIRVKNLLIMYKQADKYIP